MKKPVRQLNPEVARKIAAGEVIDRPNAIIRELLDNAVDSGASKIDVEIYSGGIEKIRVIDNGHGMTKEDLENCAKPHSTSKISSEEDLLKLNTLGFRGEALASMAAVSNLEIKSSGWEMTTQLNGENIIKPSANINGTIVQTSRLFENFPARRLFLKREASEALLCRSTFEEKVLPRPDIAFTFSVDGEQKISLPSNQNLKERFVQAMNYFESEELFYEIKSEDIDKNWSFSLIIGEPSVTRSNRKNIFIYVNGRRIQEYALIQAIEYGCEGYFPNGTHPIACIFVQMKSELVDFNIHPAKKEAKFKDLSSLHHGISSAVKNFFKKYTVKNLVDNSLNIESPEQNILSGFEDISSNSKSYPNQNYNLNKSIYYSEKNYNNDLRSRFISSSLKKDFHNQNIAENLNSNFQEKEFQEQAKNINDNYIDFEKDQNSGFHYIGLALGTFIIAEKNNSLYIIDQHAAHERIIYNSLLEISNEKQNLLVPYQIQTSSISEDKFLMEIKDDLEKSGFSCNNLGDGKWEFYSVPIRWKGTQEDLKKDLLDKRINPKDLLNSVIASTACRSAVMDGTVLGEEKAKEIAKKALELEDPHCPHGRPVFTIITREQLFQLVKRT